MTGARGQERERGREREMWRCEDEKMRRCEDVKKRERKRRCVKMCRCEDVKMWRREDVKMICVDVKRKMWRCITNINRPPLLEEPFAQTLSEKPSAATNCYLCFYTPLLTRLPNGSRLLPLVPQHPACPTLQESWLATCHHWFYRPPLPTLSQAFKGSPVVSRFLLHRPTCRALSNIFSGGRQHQGVSPLVIIKGFNMAQLGQVVKHAPNTLNTLEQQYEPMWLNVVGCGWYVPLLMWTQRMCLLELPSSQLCDASQCSMCRPWICGNKMHQLPNSARLGPFATDGHFWYSTNTDLVRELLLKMSSSQSLQKYRQNPKRANGI